MPCNICSTKYAPGTKTRKIGNGNPHIALSKSIARAVAVLPVMPIFHHQTNGICTIRYKTHPSLDLLSRFASKNPRRLRLFLLVCDIPVLRHVKNYCLTLPGLPRRLRRRYGIATFAAAPAHCRDARKNNCRADQNGYQPR